MASLGWGKKAGWIGAGWLSWCRFVNNTAIFFDCGSRITISFAADALKLLSINSTLSLSCSAGGRSGKKAGAHYCSLNNQQRGTPPQRKKTMADDATRTSTTSLEDDDDQRYLDDAAWARREEGYRQQIKALEEQHKTLKNAWSDIVRTNLLKVDELKKELEAKRAKRDGIRDALAAARSTGAATHDRLVAELCSAKVEVAELNERRDRARKKLGEEARTLVGL